MNGQKAFRFVLAATTLAACVGATEARADSCSASISGIISRSTGGECSSALSLNEEFTLTYRLTNASIVDDGGSPNDQEPVGATVPAGGALDASLAETESDGSGIELPDVLEFVPVCSLGSSLNEGEECASDAECGTGDCGCVEALPGVTCTAVGGNHVDIDISQDVEFGPAEQLPIATIRVRVTELVEPPAICGRFFTRAETVGDILVTDDPLCTGEVTAGAQFSADLHAPECASDADCGDTECNVCADQGTDNHCETANEGDECGTDGDPDDCQTPACVAGSCEQDEIDVPAGTDCDDGEDVDCTEDECDADGNCDHTPNDDLCDDQDNCTNQTCDPVEDCIYEFICEGGAICRSPGYWATHSGTEKTNSVNVAQEVIDAVGGSIEVCGETITTTGDTGSLDSNTEGLCVKVKGVRERQLYRQLVAAALNCAISGGNGDCDTVLGPLTEVSFDDCSDLCAGDPVVDGPTINECIANLDCFNNGGHVIEGECVLGTCSGSNDGCNIDDDCEGDETCDLFPDNCHEEELCNEDLDVCPKGGGAGSSGACRSARANECTIDDCN